MKPNTGVYALRHKATGRVYIGSSFNLWDRRKKWWARMNRDQQDLPPLMREVTQSRHDWEFVVLWATDTPVTPEQLKQYEAQALAALRGRAAARVVNTFSVRRPEEAGLTAGGRTQSIRAWAKETGIPRATIAARLETGWTSGQAVGLELRPPRDYRATMKQSSLTRALMVVIDDKGRAMLISEAAEALGCTHKSMAKRLARLRARDGSTSVTLAELRQASEKAGRVLPGV